ncbi:MAG: alpha/beta hydrolase [Alphaproteobacteria bacterium]|nr:alpha/beta hydrolase [Alphaproteobacteria bacterium]
MTTNAPAATRPTLRVAASSSDNSYTISRCDRDMRRVLVKLQELGAKPLGTQSPEETRKQPSPADAVRAVLIDQGKDPVALMAAMKVSKRDVTYPTGGTTLQARIYKPEKVDARAAAGTPVLVYYHGGGWVIADIAAYEASAMALAAKTGAIVVSIEYRHAPEHKFPAQHEDAWNAYKWVLENAKSWGGNPMNIAVAGESAGGNLAVNVAIMARDQKIQAPAHMLLIYPVAGMDTNTPSYMENENAIPLSKQGMKWFVANTIGSEEDKNSPLLDIVGKADLKKLPDATILTAEIDPLLTDGQLLAANLRVGGSRVRFENFEGVCHEFFGMDAVVDAAARAQDIAAEELKSAFKSGFKA